MNLSIKTDAAEAELGLWDGAKAIEIYRWSSGRQLSEQLLDQITKLLNRHNLNFQSLMGVVVFRGPGSFTGLRIGATVSNALAYGLGIPIVGTQGEDWAKVGLNRLNKGQNDQQVVPYYGAPPNITKPKH